MTKQPTKKPVRLPGRPRIFDGYVAINVRLADTQYAAISAATGGHGISDYVRQALDEKLARDQVGGGEN